jgi:predicted small lipoprotein YifL
MKYFVCIIVFAIAACGADGPPKKPSAEKYNSTLGKE